MSRDFSNNITSPLSAFGDLRTAELSPQFQGSFEYTVDNTDLFEQTISNGGTITQADGNIIKLSRDKSKKGNYKIDKATAGRDLKRRIKEEFDEHLGSINENTNEIQANYEYLCNTDSKIDKLNENKLSINE